MNVSIIGITGYGGIELLRILQHHPLFKLHTIHSTKEELPIWSEYPHLIQLVNKHTEQIDYEKIAAESELVFLATPSGISSKLAEGFMNTGIKLIDLSGDLRLKKADDYKHWYKHEPAHAKALAQSVYGLSEWKAADIKRANWIANPGCYATSALLGLAPIIKEKAVVANSIIIDGKSGVSGAGKSLVKSSLYAEVNENFKIYKVNEHQHIPEIEQQLLEWNEEIKPITFSTHLVPMTRGIMTTIYVQLKKEWKAAELFELYSEMYKHAPFIRIRPNGTYPAVKEVNGSNYCDIGVTVDERTGRATIVTVIDNLMKGAAGQAVQNANMLAGLEQTVGLEFIPHYP